MAIRDVHDDFIGSSELGNTVYEYDWFSGSQINVMIGDVLIDNSVAISFSVQQSKTPVWGYGSQYYSFVAPGKVIVQGSLTIAFKETGYLLWPMKRFAELSSKVEAQIAAGEPVDGFSPRYSVGEQGERVSSYKEEGTSGNPLTAAGEAAANKRVMVANVEQMVSWDADARSAGKRLEQRQGQLRRKYNRFYRDLGALSDTQFEKYAEVFEDVVWFGTDRANPFIRDRTFSNDITDAKYGDDVEMIYQHRRADQYPPIDIFIVYGDMSRQQPNHTVKKILDVSFTGQAQTIEISGQPTFEQYEFIARNLV